MNVLLNAIGIVLGAFGIWFAIELVRSTMMLVSWVHPKQATGPAGLAVATVSLIGLFGVFVFGLLSVVCITIARWILEPLRRWREWRAHPARE